MHLLSGVDVCATPAAVSCAQSPLVSLPRLSRSPHGELHHDVKHIDVHRVIHELTYRGTPIAYAKRWQRLCAHMARYPSRTQAHMTIGSTRRRLDPDVPVLT